MTLQENNGKAVTQQPTRKASLGGLTGSYDFYFGCPLEHLQNMGEHLR